MGAVRCYRYGEADVMRYEDADRPSPGAGPVLVQVASTSFNAVDGGIRAGYLQQACLAVPAHPLVRRGATGRTSSSITPRHRLRVAVGATYPLTELAAVHERGAAGELRRKVVLPAVRDLTTSARRGQYKGAECGPTARLDQLVAQDRSGSLSVTSR